MQQAIQACPDQSPDGVTCQQLALMAQHINALGYQLQQSPQGFGLKILALQETIARQQEQANVTEELENNKQDLVALLSIVKWLESPVS